MTGKHQSNVETGANLETHGSTLKHQMNTDEDFGIISHVNYWGDEHSAPQRILHVLRRTVAISIETVEIVKSWPKLRIAEIQA